MSSRKPTRLKLLSGSAQHDPGRVNRHEPQPGGRPRMPADMSDEAKRVWRRIMWNFGQTDVLRGADEIAMRLLAEAQERYLESAALLRQSGPLIVDKHHGGQPVKNPLHQIVRDNALLVRSLCREIGLTPSSRAGLEVADPLSDDPTAAWLRERDKP